MAQSQRGTHLYCESNARPGSGRNVCFLWGNLPEGCHLPVRISLHRAAMQNTQGQQNRSPDRHRVHDLLKLRRWQLGCSTLDGKHFPLAKQDADVGHRGPWPPPSPSSRVPVPRPLTGPWPEPRRMYVGECTCAASNLRTFSGLLPLCFGFCFPPLLLLFHCIKESKQDQDSFCPASSSSFWAFALASSSALALAVWPTVEVFSGDALGLWRLRLRPRHSSSAGPMMAESPSLAKWKAHAHHPKSTSCEDSCISLSTLELDVTREDNVTKLEHSPSPAHGHLPHHRGASAELHPGLLQEPQRPRSRPGVAPITCIAGGPGSGACTFASRCSREEEPHRGPIVALSRLPTCTGPPGPPAPAAGLACIGGSNHNSHSPLEDSGLSPVGTAFCIGLNVASRGAVQSFALHQHTFNFLPQHEHGFLLQVPDGSTCACACAVGAAGLAFFGMALPRLGADASAEATEIHDGVWRGGRGAQPGAFVEAVSASFASACDDMLSQAGGGGWGVGGAWHATSGAMRL